MRERLIGMGKPVIMCLPGVGLEGRTSRPIGSWIKHRNVKRIDNVFKAMAYLSPAPALPGEEIGRLVEEIDSRMARRGESSAAYQETAGLLVRLWPTLRAALSRQPAPGWNEAIEACANIAARKAMWWSANTHQDDVSRMATEVAKKIEAEILALTRPTTDAQEQPPPPATP